MTNADKNGKHRCCDCKYCDMEKMMCFPQSEDCESSYKLDESDLTTEERCDFFAPKNQV